MGLRRALVVACVAIAGTVMWAGTASAAPIDTSRNLIDGGGPILPTSHTYEVWWGNANAWPSDTPAALTDFLGGLNKSRYLQTAKEYMRGATLRRRTLRATGSAPAGLANPSRLFCANACVQL